MGNINKIVFYARGREGLKKANFSIDLQVFISLCLCEDGLGLCLSATRIIFLVIVPEYLNIHVIRDKPCTRESDLEKFLI